MASEAPDPQSLQSWEDAFQWPIPTVRRVEQELRRDIANSKERLRALVGTRYRDLLGTAETIVSMNRDIQAVESKLADVGHRCNPRLIEKKSTHYGQVTNKTPSDELAKRAFAAQLALLHRCVTAISKLLRRKGSLLLVAKLLVISRLLHKTLSQGSTVPPFLETLRLQLVSLRRHLLKRIDKGLSPPEIAVDDILEIVAAYCLATSSSSDDAIRHFHQVRLDGINGLLQRKDQSGAHVLQALHLYGRTLQTSRTLLSRRLSDTLGSLKTRPILADLEIQSVEDLDLDILGRWVAPDVSNFTPWIKLSEYSKIEAEMVLKDWAKDALEHFYTGCRASLATWNDFAGLLALRRKTIEAWLTSRVETSGHSPVTGLGGIRSVFNDRLSAILSRRARALDTVGRAVSLQVTNWDAKEHPVARSLWDSDLIDLDYSNGAANFKQAVSHRLLGQDERVSTVQRQYQSWRETILESSKLLDGLRRARWHDLLDELVTDEDVGVDVAAILNEDDPRLLRDALKQSVTESFSTLQTSFHASFRSFGDTALSGKAAFMLRSIKLIRRDIPYDLVDGDNYSFCKEIVPELQGILATEVAKQTGPISGRLYATDKNGSLAGRSLWEGDPALPVQPSLAAFKFLRQLMETMQRFGQDAWDPSTVTALKSVLDRSLNETMDSMYTTLQKYGSLIAPGAEEGAESGSSTESPAGQNKTAQPDASAPEGGTSHGSQNIPEAQLQLLFDIFYLQKALAVKRSQHAALVPAMERIQRDHGSQPQMIETLKKSAEAYWQRSQLLFGLLVVDHRS